MLVKKEIRTLQHPTEPDAWVKVRLPLAAGDMEGLRIDGTRVGMTFDLMASVIVEWSVPEPISLETIRLLDMDTFNWLNTEIVAASGIRGEEKKETSDTASLPTPSTADDSPPSSAT